MQAFLSLLEYTTEMPHAVLTVGLMCVTVLVIGVVHSSKDPILLTVGLMCVTVLVIGVVHSSKDPILLTVGLMCLSRRVRLRRRLPHRLGVQRRVRVLLRRPRTGLR